MCKSRSNVLFSSLCMSLIFSCTVSWHFIYLVFDSSFGKVKIMLYYEEFRQYPDQMWFYYYVYTMCFILVLIIAWLGNSRDLHTVKVLGLDNFWWKKERKHMLIPMAYGFFYHSKDKECLHLLIWVYSNLIN